MAIYDADGNQIYRCYDVDGNELIRAYDADGNIIFSKSAIPLKVMAYNVGGWYTGTGTNVPAEQDAEYYALHNSIIQNADADILCIEEYWNQFSKTGRTALSMLSQYYQYIEARNGTNQYYGRAICSKYPIESYTTNAFTVNANRYFDRAVINVSGKLLNVLVTLPEPQSASNRRQQIAQIFNYVQNYDNVILCGDFNTPITSVTDDEYVNNYTQFINAGYHLSNGGEFGFINTYSGTTDGSTWSNLDQIITSSNISIKSVTTDTTKVTDSIMDKIDHIPIIAIVEIPV